MDAFVVDRIDALTAGLRGFQIREQMVVGHVSQLYLGGEGILRILSDLVDDDLALQMFPLCGRRRDDAVGGSLVERVIFVHGGLVAAVPALDVVLPGRHFELGAAARTAVADIVEMGAEAFFRLIGIVMLLVPLEIVMAGYFVDPLLNLLRGHLPQVFWREEQAELGAELAGTVFIREFAGRKVAALEGGEIDRDAEHLQETARPRDGRLVVTEYRGKALRCESDHPVALDDVPDRPQR